MTEHESSRTTPRATEHDSETTDQTTSAPQDATAYPSRADVHHTGRAPRLRLPRPLRGRKAAVPVALTVTALSTGMAAGVATAASGNGSDAPAETTTTTVAGGSPDDRTQTTAVGKITPAASSPDTAKAEAALSRAELLSTSSAELTTSERKKVAALSDDVRAIVEDTAAAGATPAASRSTEREPLAERTAEASEEDAAETDEDAAGTTESASTGPAAVPTIAPAALAEAPGTVASVGATGDLTDTATATAPDRDADAASRDASRTERPAAEADVRDELTDKTTALKKVLDKAENATADIEPAPPEPEPAPEPAPAPAKSPEKPTAPAEDRRGSAAYLAEHADDTKGYGNGEIPSSELCELSFAPGEMLRCDATAQLEKLDAAYHAAFGTHLEITDSYRSYAEQVAVQASRGYLAATPGTSNHGWAVAVDLGGGVESFGSAQYEWLQANGAAYGWAQPGWAQAGGGKPEAWHWEYKAP